jgi:hypothetical protein
MTSNIGAPEWLPLAEQASKETDTRKLSAFVEQLCEALDKEVKPKGNSAARVSE